MEREERIKELARRILNAFLDYDDFTYEAIAHLVGVVDRLCEKENIIKKDEFIKYVYSIIGSVYKASSGKQEWRPSTEHPQMDEEVIALVGEYDEIYFAHIVDKNKAIDYDGWNIPDVKCWIPCPKIKED